MKKTLLACAIVLLSISTTLGQSSLSAEEVTELTGLKDQISGTYQIQMIDTRSRPTMPLVVFREIDQRRHQSDVVYYQVNPRMRIKILPEDVINDPNYQIPKVVTYVNSSDL